MYPLPAVLVNCPPTAVPDLRPGLAENAVTIAVEHPSADALLAQPPAQFGARHIFVVRVGSLDEAEQMGRVGAAFPGNPVLALVEGDYDPAALFHVNRRGAAQLVPVPFTRGDLGAALERVLVQFGVQKSQCRVIAVGGVVEGCGATTTAINLAAEFPALSGAPCVLTEFARGLGRLSGLLNLAPPLTTADVLTGPGAPDLVTVQSALAHVNDRFSVLVGPYRSLDPVRPGAGAGVKLVRLLRQVAGFAVLDVPATFDAEYFEIVGEADRLVLVLRQDVPSVQAAKLLIEGLRERNLPDPVLLVNEYEPGRDQFTLARIRERLGTNSVYAVHPDADGVRAAANEGKPLGAVRPTGHATRDLHHIAVELLRTTGVPLQETRPTVWKWVREKFGLGA
ncbi:Uncharacterized protein OS=Isosphaera pallida (strain ATCC 43644 / DSM 9630 / IS1B) GN=Isop_3714 PE=4 SV=1: AAA_31 [Gemmata massiliana]|uniref:Uncharacterized protein n=1 Tax=Gemmata massiliana TaxID=1210884 RepID=A0A6P2CW57_9BACT|nr:hypothetical protein [Gemmata massiliana]VTR91332.1 Uncharacterized protein OS=Isosphaera pallida (strain ATCC 43644 / DSM 9630 / IS1B) GN=Isop_3714 PE=4 SV=1: AAA_31 [Gemmata massiliana]